MILKRLRVFTNGKWLRRVTAPDPSGKEPATCSSIKKKKFPIKAITPPRIYAEKVLDSYHRRALIEYVILSVIILVIDCCYFVTHFIHPLHTYIKQTCIRHMQKYIHIHYAYMCTFYMLYVCMQNT